MPTYATQIEQEAAAFRSRTQPRAGFVLDLSPKLDSYVGTYNAKRKGVVVTSNPNFSAALAVRRPRWAIYEGQALEAWAGGLASQFSIGVIDLIASNPWDDLALLLRLPPRGAFSLVVTDSFVSSIRNGEMLGKGYFEPARAACGGVYECAHNYAMVVEQTLRSMLPARFDAAEVMTTQVPTIGGNPSHTHWTARFRGE